MVDPGKVILTYAGVEHFSPGSSRELSRQQIQKAGGGIIIGVEDQARAGAKLAYAQQNGIGSLLGQVAGLPPGLVWQYKDGVDAAHLRIDWDGLLTPASQVENGFASF